MNAVEYKQIPFEICNQTCSMFSFILNADMSYKYTWYWSYILEILPMQLKIKSLPESGQE